MKIFFIFFILNLSLFADIGFKNIKIGMTEKNLQEVVNNNLFCNEVKGSRGCLTTREHKYTIVGIKNNFPIHISLKDDKVKLIRIKSNYINFKRIVSAYKSKYGKPSFEKTKILQNRMGATFKSKEIEWILKDGKILIKERARKYDEMAIYIISKDFDKVSKKEKKKLQKKYSNDI